ncbi:MAG: hypothetical protein D3925_00145 [Candidatus Electrothrix sp. AR5]|nr:hypothetical protein [Candidatus Electrothrix sp. AR5]
MKKINIDTLQKGDIVLTTSTAKKPSGVIRTVSRSDISHAMICVAYGSVIDSTGEGVQARNIQKMIYDDSSPIYILRPKEILPETVIIEVVNFARSQIGTRYSKSEAALSVFPKLIKKGGRKQFCSRMVAKAYSSVGINLVDNPDYCTPEDIKKSEQLEFVAPSFILVNKEDVDDTTEGFRDVTNKLLVKLRDLDEKIESLNDVHDLVVQRPDLDANIAQSLRDSGFLEYWRIEVLRFPWRYDPDRIVHYYHSLDLEDTKKLFAYCDSVIKSDQNGDFDHWICNAKFYKNQHSCYGHETFQLLAYLYSKLSSLYIEKIQSANIILKMYRNY